MLELEGMPSFFFVYEICLFFQEGDFYYALHWVYTLFFIISIFFAVRELFFLPSITPSFYTLFFCVRPQFLFCFLGGVRSLFALFFLIFPAKIHPPLFLG